MYIDGTLAAHDRRRVCAATSANLFGSRGYYLRYGECSTRRLLHQRLTADDVRRTLQRDHQRGGYAAQILRTTLRATGVSTNGSTLGAKNSGSRARPLTASIALTAPRCPNCRAGYPGRDY